MLYKILGKVFSIVFFIFLLTSFNFYSSRMAAKTQDMPPPGGYQKIEFKRIPARVYFSGYQMILGYIGKLFLLFFFDL